MNDTMQALILKRYGADGLHIADVPRPTIGPDEILVRVHAAGINPIDNMIPKGMFKPILKFDLPAVMGSDLAGTVVEVGGRVSRFQVGDAVYASVFDLGRVVSRSSWPFPSAWRPASRRTLASSKRRPCPWSA